VRLRSVVVFVALALAGCGSNNTAATIPSASPVPAPAPMPVPGPTPAPAPIPAPAGPKFTVNGVVHDGKDGSPLAGVTVTLAPIGLCGHTVPGLVSTTTVTDAQGRYSVVQDATQLFSVVGGGGEGEARFMRTGFDDLCGVLLLRGDRNINVTLPRAGCYTFPNVPNPMVTRGADFIEFSWSRIEGVRDYLVEVGPVEGFDPTDTAFRAPTALQTMTGGATRYRWNTPNLVPGNYWVGVSAKGDCGMGGFINIPLRFSYP